MLVLLNYCLLWIRSVLPRSAIFWILYYREARAAMSLVQSGDYYGKREKESERLSESKTERKRYLGFTSPIFLLQPSSHTDHSQPKWHGLPDSTTPTLQSLMFCGIKFINQESLQQIVRPDLFLQNIAVLAPWYPVDLGAAAETLLPFSAFLPLSDSFFTLHFLTISLGFLWYEVFGYLLLCGFVSFIFWVLFVCFPILNGWRYLHFAIVYITLLICSVSSFQHIYLEPTQSQALL